MGAFHDWSWCAWQVHWAYVDCVRWFGDIVLSKSVHNKIFLWEPDCSSAEAKRKGYVKCHQVPCWMCHMPVPKCMSVCIEAYASLAIACVAQHSQQPQTKLMFSGLSP